jgi:Kdo2-lipid IVA lauroyltransferase/acyltransferase
VAQILKNLLPIAHRSSFTKQFLSWCSFAALRLLAFLFRFIPFRGLYALSDLMAFVLYRVLGYRKKVVMDNLRRVFPKKKEAELQKLARGSYRNLCDITLETIKSFSMNQAERWQHCPIKNPELVNAFLEKGQSVIISGSHYNNWELACLTIPMAFRGGNAVTVYKPLSNRIMDAWMNQNRARGPI